MMNGVDSVVCQLCNTNDNFLPNIQENKNHDNFFFFFLYQVFMFFFYEHLENNLEKSLEGFGGAGTATTPSKT